MSPMTKKHSLSDLDLDNRRLDDRWTYTKLKAAGYEDRDFGRCRHCHESVHFWRHNEKMRWLILDEGTLEVHACKAR